MKEWKEWFASYCRYLTWREWILLIIIISAIVLIIIDNYKAFAILVCLAIIMGFGIIDFHDREISLELAQEYIDNEEFIKAHDQLEYVKHRCRYGGSSGSKYNEEEMLESIQIPYLYELGIEAEIDNDFMSAVSYFSKCGKYKDSGYRIIKNMEMYLKQNEAMEDYKRWIN